MFRQVVMYVRSFLHVYIVYMMVYILCKKNIFSMGISCSWSLSVVSYGVAESMDHNYSVYCLSAS